VGVIVAPPQRVFLGRDVRVMLERPDGVELEGAIRLRPGHLVHLVATTSPPHVRPAVVVSWQVTRLGRKGPIYRGDCRWEETPAD
jgi:hypothetical protein